MRLQEFEIGKRFIGLDIIRSFAILLVVYEHSLILFPNISTYKNSFVFIELDGVSVFFVLSGFLVGKIIFDLIQEKQVNFRSLLKFWVYRWFRTIPTYYLVLSFVLFYYWFTKQDYSSFSASYFFFLQNLTSSHPDFYKEAWSLSVEEWFYFLFPIIFLILSFILKNKSKSLLISLLIFILFSFILRTINFEQNLHIVDYSEDIRKVVVYRLDSIMYGILSFLISIKYTHSWLNHKKIYLFIGILGLLFFELNSKYSFFEIYKPLIFSLESIFIALLIPYFSQLKLLKIRFFNPVFYFFSKISYSMYLINLTVIQIALLPFIMKSLNQFESLKLMNYLPFILFWILTILLSTALYFLFEKPMTNLRTRFFKTKSEELRMKN